MAPKEVKAAVMTEWGKIETQTFPYPENVPANTMVVKMKMAGLCGTDKHIFHGYAPDMPLPLILGHENLGEVYEIGDGGYNDAYGSPLSVGDRVTWFPGITCGECYACRWLPQNRNGVLCENMAAYGAGLTCDKPPYLFGGFAEYIYIKPGLWFFKIPDAMSDEEGVLVDILAAVSGIRKAMFSPVIKEGFGPGDTVAIQGSGPIGLAAGITAKLMGANEIILIGAPEHRLRLAESFGIFDHVISLEEYSTADERVKEIKRLTPYSQGPDMVVDCTGIPESLPEGLDMVRRGGTFVEIGSFMDTGEVAISPARHICVKDVYIIGQYAYNAQYYETAINLILNAGQLGIPTGKLVTHQYKIDDVARALSEFERLECMKGVIVP